VAAVPDTLPAVLEHVVRYRSVEYSYFQNVVESSYSFVFYSWSDWEKLIDWQALVGINLGLAYTGQEEVYRKTFARFGVNDSAFGNWTNGPAWLSWSRGQSMHGVGAGGGGLPANVALTRSWMAAQHDLQKQILGRMREIGKFVLRCV
jgi:alpha-N-acetylglucosaminidase